LAKLYFLNGKETQIGGFELSSKNTLLIRRGSSLLCLVETKNDFLGRSRLDPKVAHALSLPFLESLSRTRQLDVDATNRVKSVDIFLPSLIDAFFVAMHAEPEFLKREGRLSA
jgi:hypothetical protein